VLYAVITSMSVSDWVHATSSSSSSSDGSSHAALLLHIRFARCIEVAHTSASTLLATLCMELLLHIPSVLQLHDRLYWHVIALLVASYVIVVLVVSGLCIYFLALLLSAASVSNGRLVLLLSSTSTTASISTHTFSGSELVPSALRACRPLSANTLPSRFEAPLITDGYNNNNNNTQLQCTIAGIMK
jgi:hypothetical protein